MRSARLPVTNVMRIHVALASKWAFCVSADCIGVTVMGVERAFINIWKIRRLLLVLSWTFFFVNDYCHSHRNELSKALKIYIYYWSIMRSAYCDFQERAKFKIRQLTFAFFSAVNHLSEPLRKQNFTYRGSKGHGLWSVIGGFQSILCVSVFRGSLLVIVIMIDGSEKRNCEGGFWTLEFACLWKAQ